MIRLNCTLNFKPLSIDIEPGETLLEMLRERLYLTGTKKGCEVGECGACTVLIDDVPYDSCIYLATLAEGKNITTIEGLATDGKLSSLQEAFLTEGAVQCGYCSPGVILTAHALLLKNKKPNIEEIKRELSGNMCRCGAYTNIIRAIQKVAESK